MKALTTKTYSLTAAEAFSDGTCRPDALLELMQDAAGYHASILGIGMDVMYSKHNCLWMLVRNWFRLDRPLMAGDTLTVETWPMKPDGLSSNRAFRFYANGQPIGEAFQVWVLVDVVKRRISRIKDFPEFAALDYVESEAPVNLRRLRLPANMAVAGSCQVAERDIDANGHMNNTRYLVYVMQLLGEKFVQELHINYDRECLAGEKLELLLGQDENGTYVTGRKEDHAQSFEVLLKLL